MAYNLTVGILAVVATFELMLCESVPTDQFNDMTSLIDDTRCLCPSGPGG